MAKISADECLLCVRYVLLALAELSFCHSSYGWDYEKPVSQCVVFDVPIYEAIHWLISLLKILRL